jgi:hypothetical protein
MARTIHEGHGGGLVGVGRVGGTADYTAVHLPLVRGADVVQLDRGVLGVHHERLDPDDRHLPAVHAPHQLARDLGLLRRARRLGHHVLLDHLQRRHLLRASGVQGLRHEPDVLLLHAGDRAHDPAHPHTAQDPRLDQLAAAGALLVQFQCVPEGSPEKHDRLGSVVPVHDNHLDHLLAVAVKRIPADAGPERGGVPDGDVGVVLAVGRLVAAGRVLVLGLAEPLALGVRPGADVRVDLPAARHRGLHARRTRADHRAAEVQHQQPQGVRHHRLHLRHHPLHLQDAQQVAHEHHLDLPRPPRRP